MIVGVDNGNPASVTLQGKQQEAFSGKCLVIVQATNTVGLSR